MTSASVVAPRISSPASTGSAGTFFEQHVDATFLCLLLVRGIPPVLTDCGVVEVYFQTENLGWATDDFLLIGQTGTGARRKLLGQAKRSFSVSSGDEECQKTIEDCWKDFHSGQFDAATDRLAIVTMRGTTVLLEHFGGLLDCARAARDAQEFERRLGIPGLLSKKSVAYYEDIRTIVSGVQGHEITKSELWPFLRVLHLISLDLATATAQVEANMKSLLAHTATKVNALDVAETSWNALLREVGDGMPQARQYRRDDLPLAIRENHRPIDTSDDRILRALADHSSLILESVRGQIADGIQLPRAVLVQEVLGAAELAQVVAVSGPAGSGKSSVAKAALHALSANHFIFCFRAEEFAHPHLDETLQRALIPANATAIAAILAGQTRKVLLVESVERLLEASTRSAFADLLLLVRNDPSWKLVLTCRDYSIELVRSALLESAGIKHSVVDIPRLDASEIEEVRTSCPKLSLPLSHDPLRRLLTSPYLLDKAALMNWPEDRPLPASEREFRAKFWQEVVRRSDFTSEGMPRRREEAFMQVALSRARALSLYVSRVDLDTAAVEALHQDSLLAFADGSDVLVAPAHDVLEDWAILRWIEEQYATHEGSLSILSASLGTYPAIRRTYRKWLFELAERDPGAADRIFQSVARDATLSAQFSDDTIVSLLRCPSAPRVLAENSTLLFANGKRLFHRVVHLLRVGCVKTPPWAATSSESATLFHVPDGDAWESVLQLVRDHLTSFTADEYPLLLGLIEDWSAGVSWEIAYPPGAAAAGAIAHHLLPSLGEYNQKEQRKKILRVLAKIPNANVDRFIALLVGNPDDEDFDELAEDFRQIVLHEGQSAAACRDQSDTVMRVARQHLLLTEPDLDDDDWSLGGSSNLEPLFGLKEGLRSDYFPASGLRGVFRPLLHFHPRKAITFLIELFNHSAEWYASDRIHREYVEPPVEIELTFKDGSRQKQWCNGRLWNLYRGTSVGPYVLQSALMALETFLLELAETFPEQLDLWLVRILRESSSAALSSVVASVATAYPHRSGEAILVFLSSRDCVVLDKSRLVHESGASSKVLTMMPMLQPGNKIYHQERQQADARPHRSYDLETAVVQLQVGPFGPQVQALLDAHRAALPPLEGQTEGDHIWRLALHRMDLRQFEASVEPSPTNGDEAGDEQPEDGGQRIRLDLKVPDADLREMAAQSAASFAEMSARIGLLMWGVTVFHREQGNYDPATWRTQLQQARATLPLNTQTDHESDLGVGGPEYVAAVCVRDHWEELNLEEQEWCATKVCEEVERGANAWNHFDRAQRYRMSADRGCAWVISSLVGKPLAEAHQQRILKGIVLAITHPNDEVRQYATSGAANNLWKIDRELAMRCVNASAMEAILVQGTLAEEQKLPFASRRRTEVLEAQAAYVIREDFFGAPAMFEDAHREFDTTDWMGSEANVRVLTILAGVPGEPVTIEAFERLATVLVKWWDEDRRQRHRQGDSHSHDVEMALMDLLENILLRVGELQATAIARPLLGAVNKHTRNLSYILDSLAAVEDRIRHTVQFWNLWQQFADAVKRATWLANVDDEYSRDEGLLRSVFLTKYWKESVRHWASLDGHAERVDRLFEELPASAAVLDAYVRFLYHIGEKSLPRAFVRIANRLRTGDATSLLRSENSVFLLEALLRRNVYANPLELKNNRELREAVIDLLDRLVDRGSSAAYRMRDDFVTPIKVS